VLLKNIEIKGFKSFADPVKLEFKPAITAVVGPNGSGKSNIADAIRWVLGEQSAKALRGSKMKDVIFAGSNQRRALSSAEVSLTLDNTSGELPIDYKEVTITRRVDKSGSSDYLINNNKCRLKDINELLMDTGIGKEAYSIIGQGKVKAILSGQATDRRELFEEAAGISKHKQRKEKAVDKLETTQQKIQRVEDILSELERQLSTVSKEAEKAEEYKEYQEQLKDIEVNLLLNKYEDLEKELDDKIAAKQKLSYRVTQTKAEAEEYQLQLDNKQEELDEITSQIEDERHELFKVKSNVESLKNKLELAKERKANLGQQKEKSADEITAAKEEIQTVKERIKEKKQAKEELTVTLEKKREVLTNKEEKIKKLTKKIKQKAERQDQIRDNHLEQTNQINNSQYQLETINEELKRYQAEVNSLQAEKEELAEEVATAQRKQEQKEHKLTDLEEKLAECEGQYEEKKQQKEELAGELQDLEEQYNNLKQKLDNKQSRLDALEGLAENYSGYYRGVKNILKQADRGKLEGICGVVAELLTVPEEYELAIEVALGSSLQNVVVENNSLGQQALDYLKRNNAGRATLLPLNLVDPRDLRDREQQALQVEGAIDRATELVDYSSQYAPAIKNLLGRVVVASEIDQAVEVSKAAHKRIKVVTLDGEIVRPGGAMTGGSYNQDNNLLGRDREIEELKSEVEELKSEVKEIGQRGHKKKEQFEELKDELAALENEQHKLELQQATQQKDYQQLTEKVNRLQKRHAGQKSELKQAEDQIAELKEKRRELTENIDQLQQEDDLQGTINSLEAEIDNLEEQKEEYNQQITDLKVEVASLNEKEKQLTEEIENQRQSIADLKEKITDKQAEIKRIETKTEELAQKKEQLTAQRQQKLDKKVTIEDKLSQLEADKKELRVEIKNYRSQVESIKDKLDDIQAEFNQREVEVSQTKVKLENIEEKLETEYEIEIYDKLDDKRELTDYSSAEKQIKQLKKNRKQLEPVNLGAIDEYNNLQDRHQLLKEQHQDLREAEESLEQVISKIEGEMKNKFETTFQEIKEEFEEIFTDLFAGGKAELKLSDKDNLLETGIEVNAQPPGKKLQKLSLMSGGEKALTATALVFALLKVNPSPFYVLDELDAPLDDANVTRFANYLTKLSSRAQFIVITHRKGTMGVADALYGVSMGTAGVSELVSLDADKLAIS